MVKLFTGVNFIYILHTAFALVDPESVKNTVRSSVFFTLLGSTSVKAVHIMLVKLITDVDYCVSDVPDMCSDRILIPRRNVCPGIKDHCEKTQTTCDERYIKSTFYS